ncbi:protein of unknown function [Nonlabens sp. Hel1_33_55]|uniref:DUF4252 domain-containing protein n=1 Tax=Nonlabens sp. Hel1_33_55 TaxID=1336802 RepID=UPI000875E009|nr:DUF4252 domain-containing protein [Nonlabens sp. Hel1_33_55]SCY09203.1 protein of unknown function [Nonlabens sp. Hel1_33_55]
MNKLIFKVIAISLTAMAMLTSCEKEESLQQFYVDSAEKDGFITTSIPKSILGLTASNFSEDSQKAYESIDKVNLIALPAKEENKALYEIESRKLDQIFENDKYELLMSHSSDGIKMKMLFDGSQDAIDEIIVYGRSDEMGLGVARILGDDMNVSEIMAMIQEVQGNDLNTSGMKSIIGGLGLPVGDMKMETE